MRSQNACVSHPSQHRVEHHDPSAQSTNAAAHVTLPPRVIPRHRVKRARLLSVEIDTLTDTELLALVLRTNSRIAGDALNQAQHLLQYFGSLHALERAGLAELIEIPGITLDKAAAVHSALALGRRIAGEPMERGRSYCSSSQVYEAFGPRLSGLEQETFWVLLLDQRNRLLKQLQVAQGSINKCLIVPRQIFAPALREKAVSLILLHNHPSGVPEPSQEDRDLTQRLLHAATMLGLQILDHLVIGDTNYVSFADRGWL